MPISAIIAGGSALLGFLGSKKSGKDAQAAADLQAQILAEQAQRERELAAAESGEYLRQQTRLMGTHQALAGGTGGLYTGSMRDVAADMASEIAFQAAKIRAGGDITSARLSQEAVLARKQGSAARSASNLRAGATLLTGVGNVWGLLN